MELHNPLPRSARGWGPGSELVWREGVVVSLGLTSHPILLSPPYPLPIISIGSYAPPRDPSVGQVVCNGVRVWWWKQRRRLSRLVVSFERSLKLRSIPIRFRFRYRGFYRLPEIVQIIKYTFYAISNVSKFYL
jgi:hypothetical protein